MVAIHDDSFGRPMAESVQTVDVPVTDAASRLPQVHAGSPGLDVASLPQARPVAVAPPARRIRHIFSKVAGVSFDNPGGRSRQQILAQQCRSGMALGLVPEGYSVAELHAIQVVVPGSGEPVGYVRKELARELLGYMKTGDKVLGFATAVTQAREGATLGLNIALVVVPAGVTDSEANDYVAKVLLPAIEAKRKQRPGPADAGSGGSEVPGH